MSSEPFDRVVRVLGEAVGLADTAAIGPDTPLIGGGLSLDSVAVLEFLVGLENEWGLELDPDALLEADALRTVGTLAGYLDTLTKGGT
ncbi:MAG TPA: acyl carrier protein [Planctomycetota bacterium]|nr:acyl carrier protein [Planctomycetota bacterium]